jgi:hypothetical protein
MLNTFFLSFRLRNTFKTNTIIYGLKSVPVLKKFLPNRLYASKGLKKFANAVSILAEIGTVFIGKLIYFLIILYMLTIMGGSAPSLTLLHILMFTTIIGAVCNTSIFNPSRDKFYGIVLMRMDAAEYVISNFLYTLLKTAIGMGILSLIFGTKLHLSVLQCLAIPLYIVEVKCISVLISLKKYTRDHKVESGKIGNAVRAVIIISMLCAAIVPPCAGYTLPADTMLIAVIVLLLPACCGMHCILHFDEYREVCRKMLTPEKLMLTESSSASSLQQETMQKSITYEAKETSHRRGYAYFNDLFVKRHKKILVKSAKRIALIAFAGVAVFAAAGCILKPLSSEINKLMLTSLPYFVFVMYMINRGETITRAMFMNCDHSMLSYRFYRQPKAILTLFRYRLTSLISINLIPAVIIAAGLPFLLWITGGTDQYENYIVLFITIIAMSVFFSVHYLTLYYLFQPYTMDLKEKGAVYSAVKSLTWLVCYLSIHFEMPTVIFGAAITGFCVLYTVIACILVYRFAPKTFRLR